MADRRRIHPAFVRSQALENDIEEKLQRTIEVETSTSYDLPMDLSGIDMRFLADVEIAVRYLTSKGCSEVYLFGSLGNGAPRETSDIDIAVRGIRAEEFFAVYGELMTRLQHDVDLVDLDLQANFGRTLQDSGSLRRVA